MSDSFMMGGGFEVMFMLVFVFVIAVFAIVIVSGVRQWNKNNHAPRLAVEASVVAKRVDVSHHHHSGEHGAGHHSTSTSYYVAFQVSSGDRMEFSVSGSEHGILVEGDAGQLTFQGTRYLGFVRGQDKEER